MENFNFNFDHVKHNLILRTCLQEIAHKNDAYSIAMSNAIVEELKKRGELDANGMKK
jgi:hypothetical protein